MRITMVSKAVIVPAVTLLLGVCLFLSVPSQVPVASSKLTNARFFPYVATAAISLLSILTILSEARKRKKIQPEEISADPGKPRAQYGRVFLVFLALVIWLVVVNYIGFILATVALTASTMVIMGNRRWLRIGLTSLILPFALYALFTYGLQMVLP